MNYRLYTICIFAILFFSFSFPCSATEPVYLLKSISTNFASELELQLKKEYAQDGLLCHTAYSQHPNEDLNTPFAAFRFGIVFPPVSSAAVGLDVTFPRLGITKQFIGRIDAEGIARFDSPSFGSLRDSKLAVNFCQVYVPGGVNQSRFYIGGGAGVFIGRPTKLGGKLFIGTNISKVVSFELGGFISDTKHTGIALHVRLSAL